MYSFDLCGIKQCFKVDTHNNGDKKTRGILDSFNCLMCRFIMRKVHYHNKWIIVLTERESCNDDERTKNCETLEVDVSINEWVREPLPTSFWLETFLCFFDEWSYNVLSYIIKAFINHSFFLNIFAINDGNAKFIL